MVYETEVFAMRDVISQMMKTSQNRLLVNTDRVYLGKTNLIALESLLEERGPRGIFIAINRPYHYMAHLLRIHKVDYEEMLFIDAVSQISGERKMEWKQTTFLDSPFQVAKLFEDLKLLGKTTDGSTAIIKIIEGDFVVIDDVSAIFHYNELGTGKAFLKKFLDAVASNPKSFTAFAVDRETQRDLYEFLADNADRMVDMGNAAFMEVPKELEEEPAPMARPSEGKGGMIHE
ncbi:MAG: hypothetical protein KAW84_08705 [Thermoplasmata archaeon]|nr:hypothetical protein [Thermoplasmata archaeon]